MERYITIGWLVDFRLLGPLEIAFDEEPLVISGARERTILTLLLLQVNRVVQIEQLVDGVWDDSPPTTARSQIQQCISALRRKFARGGFADMLRTHSAGYVIRVPEEALDVRRFERLASQGRAAASEKRIAEAAADFRDALALWRGPSCAGVKSTAVRAAASRLDEDRMAALEQCIDLELQLGRHHELTGELSDLVQRYPMRERLHALYMLALHRSGRKAAALEAFRTARGTIVAELGLEPGEGLRALHRAILANDPELLAPGPDTAQGTGRIRGGTAPVPRQLPPAVADFTGRAAEAAALVRLLGGADGETSADRYLPVAVLRGKGGAGKTALALHVANALRQDYPAGHLYAQLRDGEGQPVATADILAWFLRALGMPSATVPEGLAERTAAYRSMLGERRVLVVLDDAYSAGQVLPLIPGNPGCGVIITSRDSLSGLHGSRYFEIGDLDEQSSVRFLGRIIGDDRVAAEPVAALALVRLCGCLALALRIIAAKLVAHPHWTLHGMVRRIADEETRLDELTLGDAGIRATLTLSYETLDRDAQRLFRLLGLLGAADFGSWVAAPLLGDEAARADNLLDTLVDARLVDARRGDEGTRFCLHELVRVYAQERLAIEEATGQRVTALRRMLSCWLALAAEAHRRTYGGDFAILHGTADRFLLDPRLVDALLASPLGWLRTEQAGLVSAVLQAGQAGLDELCWDLAMTIVTLFETDYQTNDWRKTHEVALAASRRAGNRIGEAAMLYSLGNLSIAEQPAAAVGYLEPALAAFQQAGHGHGQALTLAALAFIDRLSGHYERALDRYAEALAQFRLVSDLVSEVDCLSSMGLIHTENGQLEAARGQLDKAMAACETLEAPRIAAQTDYRMGSFLLQAGELARAERSFRMSLQLVREEGDSTGETYALHGLATVHARQGRHTIADAEFTAALDLSRQVGDRLVRGRILLAYAEAKLARHETDQASALADEALTVFGEAGGATVWKARATALRTRLADLG